MRVEVREEGEGWSKAVREIKCIKCNTAKPPIITKTSLSGPCVRAHPTQSFIWTTRKTFDVFIIAFSGVL
jgi:hypothetical protein